MAGSTQSAPHIQQREPLALNQAVRCLNIYRLAALRLGDGAELLWVCKEWEGRPGKLGAAAAAAATVGTDAHRQHNTLAGSTLTLPGPTADPPSALACSNQAVAEARGPTEGAGPELSGGSSSVTPGSVIEDGKGGLRRAWSGAAAARLAVVPQQPAAFLPCIKPLQHAIKVGRRNPLRVHAI